MNLGIILSILGVIATIISPFLSATYKRTKKTNVNIDSSINISNSYNNYNITNITSQPSTNVNTNKSSIDEYSSILVIIFSIILIISAGYYLKYQQLILSILSMLCSLVAIFAIIKCKNIFISGFSTKKVQIPVIVGCSSLFLLIISLQYPICIPPKFDKLKLFFMNMSFKEIIFNLFKQLFPNTFESLFLLFQVIGIIFFLIIVVLLFMYLKFLKKIQNSLVKYDNNDKIKREYRNRVKDLYWFVFASFLMTNGLLAKLFSYFFLAGGLK